MIVCGRTTIDRCGRTADYLTRAAAGTLCRADDRRRCVIRFAFGQGVVGAAIEARSAFLPQRSGDAGDRAWLSRCVVVVSRPASGEEWPRWDASLSASLATWAILAFPPAWGEDLP